MIGRNDPCSCGSGKKYKKCCGKKGPDLVGMIVNEELDQILSNFFDQYPKGEDRKEMIRMMREWILRLSDSWSKEDIEEAASEFYLFVHKPEGWHEYIREQLNASKREGVLNVLKAWDEPFMLLAEILGTDEGMLEVRQLFTDEVYHVTRNEGMPVEEGTLMFGSVLRDPRKREDAIAPVSSMMFLARWSKQTKQSLMELRESKKALTPEQFIRNHALDIYELFIKRSQASLNELVEEVLNPSQFDSLKALEAALRGLGQDAGVREILHKLAVAYFMNHQSEIESKNDFVASAIWTGAELGVIRGLVSSQSEVAAQYDSTVNGMTSFVKELSSLYEEMMGSFDEPVANRAYDIGTDPRATEKGLWETAMTTTGVVQPERKPDVDEGRAQMLAYEAYAAESEEERRELAAKAYAISPNLPDVLMLAAEVETDAKKASDLYEKAIRNASKTFEPNENPWMNLPNRTFMRAAFMYGVHLFMNKEFSEAADVFKDLVRMNATDNQGARFEAVASLIHAKRFNEAAEIMVRYEKGSQSDATYLYLDWKLEHDASEGQSEEAEAMLEKAAKANGHVMHLRTFKAKTIDYPRQMFIQPGSEEEARYIWLLLNGPN
ncbi:SEC-C metal-binding domain-containing protein [Sporosarcina sp. FSL W8-0480]|uniref:tetratricopeptide repeat protein n=1 Tax=Sporosarcina sp. FSL W8-0480 TaxID=2954701 RepID=UPI0030DA34EA